MTTADAIYLLCAATSLTAAVLLLRQYRARRSRLLLWSIGIFFALGGILPGPFFAYGQFSLGRFGLGLFDQG